MYIHYFMRVKFLHKGMKVLLRNLKHISIFICLLGISLISSAQIDDEFWFVVPELSHRGGTGGTPGTFRIATLELDATVTISMPANQYDPATNPTGFRTITFDMDGNSTAAVNLDSLIDVVTRPTTNRLENKALTPTGKNNYGLHITATNMITVYWEVNYDFGSDLWTLKGENALGTEFYTPFQNVYPNRNISPRTYSAIDIVATQDGTNVTFTLPPNKSASFGLFQTVIPGTPAGATYSLTLNRGQTFSLYPVGYSLLAADRLGGTRIQSDAPIAVTVKDDAIATPPNGQDVVGDQLVPTDVIGDHYIVPDVGNPNHIYVVGTVDNTTIYVYDPDGLPLVGSPYGPINAGEQILITVPNGLKYARFTSKLNPGDPQKPFYVFQMGIENKSRGGAIVPAIGCTGNTQLAFTRARDDNKFYFFIIVEKGNEGKFFITDTNGIAMPQDGTVTPQIIDPGQFVDITGTNYVVWFSGSINSNVLTPGQHLVYNTGGIFHLGIMNGFPGQGLLYYGYYSDFGGLNIGANVAGTNSSVVRACYGNPVQLYAFGGTDYNWIPDSYLDDATSNLPTAYNLPPGSHNYTVEVSGGCDEGTVDLTVLVAEPVEAHFETNVASGCSPLEITIEDQSSGVYSWQYNLGDGTPDIRYDLNAATPYPEPPGYPAPFSITTTYINTTNDPIYDTITLLVKNESGCSDILKKTIVIFPEIHSSFTIPGGVDDGCDPLPVQFQNSSTGNTDTWLWDFGDGGSSTDQDPLHIFRNLFGPDNLNFQTRLVAISPFNCRDTSYHDITVRPYIEADFAFDTVMACTPHEIIITDQSIQADSYFWQFGDGSTSTSPGPILSKTYVNPLPDPDTFLIKLRVNNDEGCYDSIEREVIVFPEITAAFVATPGAGCSPFEVSFQNNSSGAATYFWNFGDGGTSTEANPVHLYEKNLLDHDTTYHVTLVATSTEFCTATETFDIVIHPYIEAAFTVEDIVGCHPFTITIDNKSIGAVEYFWDFGDLSPVQNTSAASFTYTYLNTTGSTVTYPLQLIVRNNENCTDTLVRYITVHPEITASFTADAFEGCHPLTVTFTDLSVNAVTYYWDFGDSASSLEASPVHTYDNFSSSDKTFMATLTTSSADGECVKSVTWPIVVHPQVEAQFTFPSALDCSPFEVTFENLSIGGTSFTWDFSDGPPLNVANKNPVTHTFVNNDFSNIQDFVVNLVARNDANCTSSISKTVRVYPDIEADFDASDTEDCQPLTVQFTNQTSGGQTYLWDFGTGSGSNLQDPEYTFTNTGSVDSVYTVKLVSIAPNNVCRDSFSIDITVHPYIKANFTLPEPLGCTPFDAVINNTSINASSYYWEFGDGSDTTTTNSNPVLHRFTNNSFSNQLQREITLTAENTAGCTSQIKRTITIQPDINAAFNPSTTEDCHPVTVSFTNQSNGASYYHWDFGDGTTSNQVNPSRIFANTGNVDSVYTVKLISIAANNVCKDSTTIDITIHPYIQAGFTIPDQIGCNYFDAAFVNSSVNATSYHWDFGDGSDTTVLNKNQIVHRFFNTGFASQKDYQITLTAENLAGCTSTIQRTVTVEPDISASFNPSLFDGCHPLTVNFSNLSNGAAYYHWDFGNGTTSPLSNPSQTFNNLGTTEITYQVWLYVTASNNVCKDSFSVDIDVHPAIKADFTVKETVQCTPSSITFSNASQGGASFSWDFGDGSDTVTTNINPVSHVFNNSSFNNIGTYQVTMTAESSAGCTSQMTIPVDVYPDIEALFTPSFDEGCHPLQVSFNNSSNGGYTYSWDFDDGSTSSATTPTHIFYNFTDAPVTKQVRLIATSRYDCVSEITTDITIHPKPKARFETDHVIDCPPFDVPLVNTSLNADLYRWTFGDGAVVDTTSSDPVTHTYLNNSGDIVTYDLKLRATSNFGCVDSLQQKIYVYPSAIADFTFNDEGCSPLPVYFTNESVRGETYLWDFGDGTSITIKDPSNLYFNRSDDDTIYFVTLTTTTEYGCVDSLTDSVFVYLEPEAEFTASPTHQDFPSTTVTLTDETNPGPWTYLWDFDDGSTSNLEDPVSHSYADWGQYDINLYVSSAHCTDTVTHSIVIFAAPPVADFDSVYAECEPLTVQFTNNSVYGDTWLWEFDDGKTSTDFEPSHTFDEYGIYNVKLTVTGDGGVDYMYRQVEVYRNPVAKFKVAPTVVMLPDDIVKFYNLSQHAVTYLWDFGDGNTSTEESPVYLYTELGTYDVSLDVWTENGCTDRFVIPDAVEVIGEAVLMFPNAFKPDLTGPNGGYYVMGDPELNNIFHPYWAGVVDYKLMIYNRWGEHVFTSEDVSIGWDGYIDGELAEEDVYIWKCDATFTNGRSDHQVGDVTLLHHDKTK